MKYKIVDTFNGGESGSFKTLEAAEKELAKQYARFRGNLITANCVFKREIAPASSTWGFNYLRNQFEWSELVNTSDTDIF